MAMMIPSKHVLQVIIIIVVIIIMYSVCKMARMYH